MTQHAATMVNANLELVRGTAIDICDKLLCGMTPEVAKEFLSCFTPTETT